MRLVRVCGSETSEGVLVRSVRVWYCEGVVLRVCASETSERL